MATIAQIVEQIRTAVYGRDVRENIAQGIEICYTDVTSGTTSANQAANSANNAAESANAAAGSATEAAQAANSAAGRVDTAINNANSAAGTANTAAGKINNMTVEATSLEPSANPTVDITEVEGHKNIEFGIPQGLTGETPDISIGQVTTVGPTYPASVELNEESTPENPIFDFTIPRGYDGPSLLTNRIWDCETSGSTAAKVVTPTVSPFTLEEGGAYIINFENKNVANYPTINIGSTGAKSIYINGEEITGGYTRNLISGVCMFIYDGTNYNLVGNFYNEGNAAISDSEIDEIFDDTP